VDPEQAAIRTIDGRDIDGRIRNGEMPLDGANRISSKYIRGLSSHGATYPSAQEKNGPEQAAPTFAERHLENSLLGKAPEDIQKKFPVSFSVLSR
jgi:hypothetical protein